MCEFDQLADHYDETRGGEGRGDEYAAEIDAVLPPDDGPILEVGVGTGVVALGLVRRGRQVVGLDISAPMLLRAQKRLGSLVMLADALEMAVATGSVAHAVSVWAVHSVADPVRLFHEVARVLRPSGLYVVSSTQRPAVDDVVGQIIKEMSERVDARRGALRPRGVTVEEVLGWAGSAGFVGTVHELQRQWRSAPAYELAAIAHRSWPALRELDDAAIDEVTRPAVEALRSLPDTDHLRRTVSDLIVFHRP
ncbi:MAG: class I SAM-dependent methyltransferase [Acidimicrobiales bacterium]